MTPDERQKIRVMGRRLAVVVRKGAVDTTSTAALQAVVADLIENQTELLPPLKDLVGRPAFQRLIPRAGSGTGSAERSALLQDLQRTFAPAVIQALAELLDSFLDLPSVHRLKDTSRNNGSPCLSRPQGLRLSRRFWSIKCSSGPGLHPKELLVGSSHLLLWLHSALDLFWRSETQSFAQCLVPVRHSRQQ